MAAAAAAAIATFAGVRRRSSRRRPSFRGHVVVITGGARGFGLALARRLAAEGARLVLISRTGDELERAALELQARGARVDAIRCDVRKPADVRDAISRVESIHGRVDMLVNNAGIIQSMPFEHATLEDFETSLDTHFWGPLHLIRACLPIMRRQGGGRIVNVSSIGGRIGVPHLSPYCAGKFALAGLSDVLHAELEKDNIAVTTATPGLMRTGSHRNVVVRGRHRREAQWFGLASATPLTSMSADRSAALVLAAARAGRAHVTCGWQARTAEVLNAVAPEVVAAAMSAAAAMILPGPDQSGEGAEARLSRDLDLGSVASILPTRAARAFNQPLAVDELRSS
jgi:NAD(P)-dependent dehydrogenase (short-subunit alcohol dehydrogenase family)